MKIFVKSIITSIIAFSFVLVAMAQEPPDLGYSVNNQTPQQWRAEQAQILAINNVYAYVYGKYHYTYIPNVKPHDSKIVFAEHKPAPARKKILITDHGFDPPRFQISGFLESAPATWVWPNDGKKHSVVMKGFFDSGVHSYPHEFTFEFTPPEFDGMGGTPYGASGAELNYKDGVSNFKGIVSISQIH